ncbi:hypothetical protein ADL00_41150 [Streptomyces sp. AS58]|nr:hypothetical protein ADL00_41150 [Streptomyces sp. AS58]
MVRTDGIMSVTVIEVDTYRGNMMERYSTVLRGQAKHFFRASDVRILKLFIGKCEVNVSAGVIHGVDLAGQFIEIVLGKPKSLSRKIARDGNYSLGERIIP